MERQTKIILLISGIVILLGAIGLGLYFYVNREKGDPKTGGADDPEGSPTDEPGTNEPVGNTPPPDYNKTIPGMITPHYNSEGELDNEISQLKGRTLFPKRKEAGGWGYANVRSSAAVNNETAWYDPFDNLLTTINAGTPIGTVADDTTGAYNGYGYRWFRVKLYEPAPFFGGLAYYGYVRADTVTIKPYAK